MLLHGDALEILKTLEDNSVDSIVCDPPAGIGFMGKDWDKDKGGRDNWIAWLEEIMREALRVLKPGGHALVWALPRTSHWTATALENAGFEVRDSVVHIQGQGFPKSTNIEKRLRKRGKLCEATKGVSDARTSSSEKERICSGTYCGDGTEARSKIETGRSSSSSESQSLRQFPGESNAVSFSQRTLGNTPQTRLHCGECGKVKREEVKGLGSALKPSHENWLLCRKPLAGKSIAENVLAWGAGGLNIDASRIGTNSDDLKRMLKTKGTNIKGQAFVSSGRDENWTPEYTPPPPSPLGRFPANLILSHHPDCEEICVDECAVQELDEHSGYLHPSGNKKSRFFYCSKASRKDRGEGNGHPIVKSTKLMEYLITLITPPGGVVMDCFMGSGSTGVAAKRLGFEFIGIEKEAEYFEIAKARCNS